MRWTPHVTVACVIEQDGQFLMVEERSNGQLVLNQPAGHLEANESLIEAAVREVLEETAWQVEVTGLLGFYTYTSPQNQICYHRWCFIARPIQQLQEQPFDPDIIQTRWMSLEELHQQQEQLRSPMVLKAVEDYLQGTCYPLALISEVK